MRKIDYRTFERPEISEWKEDFEREERCFPLPAVVAAVGIAGLAHC